jgi:ElaB/YqjD/DUF883 family membrane-anchored ribosome-binding protein
MARSRVATVADTVRSGLEDVTERASDVAEVIAGRFGDALETASGQSRRLRKQLGKDLGKRWTVIDKASRENPYYLALGALAVGVVIGYRVTRKSPEPVEQSDEGGAPATEMGL